MQRISKPMPERFVSIGEAMVEFFRRDDGLWRQGFAGDTLNVAWAARALLPDTPVAYATCVGKDGLSDAFCDFLATSGIDTGHVWRDPSRTIGLYTIETDAEGERSFSYWRGQSAARQLAADPDRLAAALRDARLVYLSGITLAILSPEDRETLFAVLKQSGGNTQIAFDPNIRPRLWEDPQTMCTAIEDAARISDIVLPTFDDEAAAFGDSSPKATRDRYRARGVAEVVVKDGVNPTLYTTDGDEGSVDVTQPVRAVDTTGAGDSFNGAYLASRLQDRSVAEAITQAQAASRAVVGIRGALLDMDALRAACA